MAAGVFHVLIDCNSTQERKEYFLVITSINDYVLTLCIFQKSTLDEIKNNRRKEEVPTAAKDIIEFLDKQKNGAEKLAFTGKSVVGKSSFINAIRNLKSGDQVLQPRQVREILQNSDMSINKRLFQCSSNINIQLSVSV